MLCLGKAQKHKEKDITRASERSTKNTNSTRKRTEMGGAAYLKYDEKTSMYLFLIYLSGDMSLACLHT